MAPRHDDAAAELEDRDGDDFADCFLADRRDADVGLAIRSLHSTMLAYVTTVRLFREQYQLVAGGGGVFGRIDALNGFGDELADGDFLEQVDLQDRENRVQTGRQFQLFARDRYQ